MRLNSLLTLSLYVTTSFGQNPAINNNDDTVCTISANCLTIIKDKQIKPFITNGNYIGKVVIQARLDTMTMMLKEHKFVFVDLHSRVNPGKKIQTGPNNQVADIQYLDSLLPKLVTHLKYLKFNMVLTKECIISTYKKFPITII